MISILLVVGFTITLVGCASVISVEYEDVSVTIVDEYHRGAWAQPVFIGKIITVVRHPATWQITVEYNGVEYTVSGSDTYNKYKDKIGQTVIGELETKTYDDGTKKYDIVSLK